MLKHFPSLEFIRQILNKKSLSQNQKPKAILIDVIPLEMSKVEAYKRLEELECLVNTYGGIVVIKTIQKRAIPDYSTFIGKGKIEEIVEIAKQEKTQFLILNNIAKPGQLFNLGEIFRKEKMEVWDRIDLILRIFDKHATTTEAKLQINLARIRHMGPRIFKMGVDLMQQEGVKGTRGGPGETNIELMKRHLKKQEDVIMKKLEHYEVINRGHRERRKRQNLKTVALVGYTNAGKSSLLKALTGKDVYIADELFATLDTRVGRLYLKDQYREILISDTIGFIQDLPPSLIQAFRSTLSEAIDADLLLHVIDISDPMMRQKIVVVEDILDQLGVSDKPKIYVFNKIDAIDLDKKEKEEIIEEPDHDKLVKKGILHPDTHNVLIAGKETARHLGWLSEDEKYVEEIDRISIENLTKKHQKCLPVFVSAAKKINLNELIGKIAKIMK